MTFDFHEVQGCVIPVAETPHLYPPISMETRAHTLLLEPEALPILEPRGGSRLTADNKFTGHMTISALLWHTKVRP